MLIEQIQTKIRKMSNLLAKAEAIRENDYYDEHGDHYNHDDLDDDIAHRDGWIQGLYEALSLIGVGLLAGNGFEVEFKNNTQKAKIIKFVDENISKCYAVTESEEFELPTISVHHVKAGDYDRMVTFMQESKFKGKVYF